MATAPLPPLARYTGSDPHVKAWSDQLIGTLEIWSRRLAVPAGEQWTVTGTTPERNIGPGMSTTDLGNALGTLLQDLSKGAPMSVTG